MPDADPPGRGPSRPWSAADDAELRAGIAARASIGEIARRIDRTMDAVRGRAQMLGLGLTPRLRPWRSDPRRRD